MMVREWRWEGVGVLVGRERVGHFDALGCPRLVLQLLRLERADVGRWGGGLCVCQGGTRWWRGLLEGGWDVQKKDNPGVDALFYLSCARTTALHCGGQKMPRKDPAKGVLAVRVQVRGGRRHSRWLAKFSYLMRTSYERTSRYELGLILLSQYYWFYLPALGRERAAPVDSSSFHRALCNTVHQLENI